MFSKILIPYDGSLASEEAYALAVELAEKYHSAIFVMVIARPPEPAIHFQANAYLDEVREHYKERFAGMGRRAGMKAVKVRFDIRIGHPAEEIVRAAQQDKIDLVIIGRRGKAAVQGRPLGTVSERVLTYANCAVLAVA
jgi:nucleotide-binding universal stress UspA family protein